MVKRLTLEAHGKEKGLKGEIGGDWQTTTGRLSQAIKEELPGLTSFTWYSSAIFEMN